MKKLMGVMGEGRLLGDQMEACEWSELRRRNRKIRNNIKERRKLKLRRAKGKRVLPLYDPET